jgi:hypothetical protein
MRAHTCTRLYIHTCISFSRGQTLRNRQHTKLQYEPTHQVLVSWPASNRALPRTHRPNTKRINVKTALSPVSHTRTDARGTHVQRRGRGPVLEAAAAPVLVLEPQVRMIDRHPRPAPALVASESDARFRPSVSHQVSSRKFSRKFRRVQTRFGGPVAARPGPAPAVPVAGAALRTPLGRPPPPRGPPRTVRPPRGGAKVTNRRAIFDLAANSDASKRVLGAPSRRPAPGPPPRY